MDSKPSVQFAQFVVGPPGSGKTSYCKAMQQLMTTIGRECIIVNLDPANDSLPYDCAINITDLISLEEVIEEHDLGPNGALLYCMEYLEANVDWLSERLSLYGSSYVVFDCPGQVELFTHHHSLRAILSHLSHPSHIPSLRFVVVHTIDITLCQDSVHFSSCLLLSLSVMLQLECPHLNVLSKLDLSSSPSFFSSLPLPPDFYLRPLDLPLLLSSMTPPRGVPKPLRSLHKALLKMAEDFSLVSFCACSCVDMKSMATLLKHCDKSNGYVYGALEAQKMLEQIQREGQSDDFLDMFEHYIHLGQEQSKDTKK